MSDIWLMPESGRAALDAKIQSTHSSGSKIKKPEMIYGSSAGGSDVTVMRIHGAMFSRANWITEMLGYYSTEQYMQAFEEIEESNDRVLLDIDGPGGEASLIFEFADMIANSSMEVTAYTGGMAASAQFLLYMAASNRYAHDSAELGSMGVRAYKPFLYGDEVVSKNAPNKIPDKKEVQKRVDALEDKFISRVSGYSGIASAKLVLLTNNGGLFLGSEAEENGLIEKTSNYKSVIKNMNNKEGSAEKEAAAKTFTQSDVDGLVASAVEGQNARWSSLLAHENGSNTAAVARLAGSTSMSAEEALSMMDMVAPTAKKEEKEDEKKSNASADEMTSAVVAALRNFQVSASDSNSVIADASVEGKKEISKEDREKAEYNRGADALSGAR